MFLIVLRKMLSNRWMVICLLIGSVITAAMMSSIPIYSQGVLQKMLKHDLESYQETTGVFPGGYKVSMSMMYTYNSTNAQKYKTYEDLNKKIDTQLIDDLGLPILTKMQEINSNTYPITPVDVQVKKDEKLRSTEIVAINNVQDHIELLYGRMYSKEKKDGVYEVIATEQSMKYSDLMLDKVYSVTDTSATRKKEKFKFKVVGVFTVKDAADPFWSQGLDNYKDKVFIDYALFMKNSSKINEIGIMGAKWYYALDYHKIGLADIGNILNINDAHRRYYWSHGNVDKFEITAVNTLSQYDGRKKQLENMLWILQLPMLVMLAFYIFMVSGLIIDYESNEIAVLKSRGASGFQVFKGYIFESVMLGILALIIGPIIGIYICRIIGSSNGFLEFVNRTALPVTLDTKAFTYSILAVVFFMLTMLIPAFLASRTSIVLYKQKKSRVQKGAFWKKFFLDVILLAIACYGLYSYKNNQKVLFMGGIKGGDMVIDPLLFIISTLFVLGTGLVFLRVFPYIVRVVFWLGKRIWSPAFYASFIQVGRNGGQEQFLMLFIIFTLSIGIFSANSARTINRNMEDKIRYETGTDMVVKAVWGHTKTLADVMAERAGSGPPPDILEQRDIQKKLDSFQYFEPAFEPFTQLKGVDKITKVLKREKLRVDFGKETVDGITLMGITPNEFADTAWFRNDLLPHHINQYLNLMADAPGAFLLSKSFKDKYKLKEGDAITIDWGDQIGLQGVVYAFVDYWPTLSPVVKSNSDKQGSVNGKDPTFYVVANLKYIQDSIAIEPYEVWIKKKPGATSNEIYKDMADKNISIEYRKDAVEQIVQKKNDPMLQGANGALTLSFVITIIITIIGFLIYWIISIKRRVLQFGILRAMGMSLKSIIAMLGYEQLMISGTAIMAGLIIGSYTSRIFVPLLQMVNGSDSQVPPFKVTAYGGDYIKLYIVILTMLVIGFAVLGRLITRINISQALKLGED